MKKHTSELIKSTKWVNQGNGNFLRILVAIFYNVSFSHYRVIASSFIQTKEQKNQPTKRHKKH